MPASQRPLSPATRAAQALRRIDARTGAITPAIELASTFARDADYAARQAYIYARDGGPTT
jgi:cystathionine gamma-synthase